MNKKLVLLVSTFLVTQIAAKIDTPPRGILSNIPKTVADYQTPQSLKDSPPADQKNNSNITPPKPTADQKQSEPKQSKLSLSGAPLLPPPPVPTAAALVTAAPSKDATPSKPIEKTASPEPTPQVIVPKAPEKKSAEDIEEDKKLKKEVESDQLVRFYFEDATLENMVHYIEELYGVTFFPDDNIAPTPTGGGVLKGNKVTFKTNKPLSRKAAWSLFLKFLDMSGLTIVPGANKNFFRITTITNANKEVLPTYFNTSVADIPEDTSRIRYVFFVQNCPLKTVENIVNAFASSTAQINNYPDLSACMIIDKALNIKALMSIISEFDRDVPETLSILKLKRADAIEIEKLYTDLTRAENPLGAIGLLSAKNQADSSYFPSNVRIIAEPRTNSMILLGEKTAVAKVEEFITKHVDVELDMPYSPLHIHELQYMQASNMADILNQITAGFGRSSGAAQFGGVRDGDQYFRPISITADSVGNRLIIKAEEKDYLKIKEFIQELDVLQPQVLIEVLIADVSIDNNKQFGSQFRNKALDKPLKNVSFQTSGIPVGGSFSVPQTITGVGSSTLLGDLLTLAKSGAGATVMAIGNQVTGIWGIVKTLQTVSKTDILSNPFLLTTNGYPAQVISGTSRLIPTSSITTYGTTAAQQGLSQISANLTVSITPQISIDGSIQMKIAINISDFGESDQASGTTLSKDINTTAIVQNKEILVLGGLARDKTTNTLNSVPLLGSIPLLGWLFKSKTKSIAKTHTFVFISPQIIYPHMRQLGKVYTNSKALDAQEMINLSGSSDASNKDPISKMFFNDNNHHDEKTIQHFVTGKEIGTVDKKTNTTLLARTKEETPKKRRNSNRRRFAKKSNDEPTQERVSV